MRRASDPPRAPARLKPIRWTEEREGLLSALFDRAARLGIVLANDSDAIESALRVAAEAPAAAWERALRRAEREG